MLIICVTMKLSFISSRRRQGQEDREETMPGTVQISVPSELVMRLLARGAILQVQIGPVPIRPILRPASSPERPEPAPLRLMLQERIPGLTLLGGLILTLPGLKGL